MAKLTGFKRVAVIQMCGADYHFALYDDDIMPGDTVLFTSVCGDQVGKVKNVISAEVAAVNYSKSITAEVICRVDMSAYEKRVENRKEAERIKKEMDKIVKKLRSEKEYDMYAKESPELQDLLMQYRRLN